MIKFKAKPKKDQSNSNIALINIIFLMLIFFMLAGRISAPLERDIELALSEYAPPAQFQEALIITKAGQLRYQGEDVTLTEFWQRFSLTQSQEIRLVVDKELRARDILTHIAQLRQLSPLSIKIFTQLNDKEG